LCYVCYRVGDVGVGKLGDLDLDLELGEDPSLFYFAKVEGNFWSRSNTTARQNATAKLEARVSRGTSLERVLFTLSLFTCQPSISYLRSNDAKQHLKAAVKTYLQYVSDNPLILRLLE
jgi:hypothetical protein